MGPRGGHYAASETRVPCGGVESWVAQISTGFNEESRMSMDMRGFIKGVTGLMIGLSGISIAVGGLRTPGRPTNRNT